MKHLGIVIAFINLSQILYGQDNYQARFVEYCSIKDIVSQREVLEEWEESDPHAPDLFASYFTYCFMLSKQLAERQIGSLKK